MDAKRRQILSLPAAALVLSAAPGGLLRAQSADPFPNRAIRMLVPFPVGGAADIVARMLAADMTANLGRSVVVENRAGASGNIAMDAAARAAPDGYTILMASASLAINPSLIAATPFDAERDFTPLSLVAMVPSVLLVPASLPVTTVQGFIDWGKRQSEPVPYGSNGIGTTQHLAAVMFGMRTGINLNHVPYKGVDGLMPDLVAGRISMSFNNVASALPHLRKGSLRALAVGLPKRWPELPEVPTFDEVGLSQFDVSSWVGLFAPAGVPVPVAATLEKAAMASLVRTETRDKMLTGGNDPVGGTAAELKDFLAREIAHWRKAIEASGAKPG